MKFNYQTELSGGSGISMHPQDPHDYHVSVCVLLIKVFGKDAQFKPILKCWLRQ